MKGLVMRECVLIFRAEKSVVVPSPLPPSDAVNYLESTGGRSKWANDLGELGLTSAADPPSKQHGFKHDGLFSQSSISASAFS